MDPEREIAYWRELATVRGRELERLRKRVLELLASLPNASALPFTSRSTASWIHEIDRIPNSPDLQQTDVVTALTELWARIPTER